MINRRLLKQKLCKTILLDNLKCGNFIFRKGKKEVKGNIKIF